jgi:hypothetical protein
MTNDKPQPEARPVSKEMKAILAAMGNEPIRQREFYRLLGVVPRLRDKLNALQRHGFIEMCGDSVWRKLRDE